MIEPRCLYCLEILTESVHNYYVRTGSINRVSSQVAVEELYGWVHWGEPRSCINHTSALRYSIGNFWYFNERELEQRHYQNYGAPFVRRAPL